MTASQVSVVVVSRGRPKLLSRCLTGLGQVCHTNFEIVVAADPEGCDAVRAMGWEAHVKLLPFDTPNISETRNAAIAEAAGNIVAFIDDDAVPEPSWLDHLTAPFADKAIAASGGYVIGRNGISFQWKARAVDKYGRKIEIDHAGDAPFEANPPDGFAPKTEGTNFAVRRVWLERLGGFDPAFRFFLDETDLNRRLADVGGRTVFVPRAIVHHGYAASDRRAVDRAPTDLSEIGASSAVFLRKHAPNCNFGDELERIVAEHRTALLRYMVDGGLEPRDVEARLAGLKTGFADGLRRNLEPLAQLATATSAFRPFPQPSEPRRTTYFAGRPWNRQALRKKARAAVGEGNIVTVFRFSPTALPHRAYFTQGGWWEQRGGLFGRAKRDEPYFKLQVFRTRVQKEWARVSELRQCGQNHTKR